MINIEPESMKIFGFWGSLLALKLFGDLLLIVKQRFTKKVFLNPEDIQFARGGKVGYNDPDVERARRVQQNDLESILPWYMVTFLWLTTGPSTWLAGLLIRTFVIARMVHTFVYGIYPQQPMRFISFAVGLAVTLYQVASTLLYYL